MLSPEDNIHSGVDVDQPERSYLADKEYEEGDVGKPDGGTVADEDQVAGDPGGSG